MGGPKARLLLPDGESYASWFVAKYAGVCAEAVVVARADSVALMRERVAGATWLASGAPEEQGPAGSIGVAAHHLLGAGSSACEVSPRLVLLSPIDCPPVSTSTVEQLLSALTRDPQRVAARPRCAGRGGHPVLLRQSVLKAYLGTEPPPLRNLLRGLGPGLAEVHVEDPAVVADLDTPQQWQAFVAAKWGAAGDPRFA